MSLTILFACIAVYCFVVGICQKLLYKQYNQKRRLKSLIKRESEIVDEKLNAPFMERFIKPAFTKTLQFISRKSKTAEKTSTEKKLEKDLMMAGIRMPPEEYNALKMIITGAFIGLMIIIVLTLSIDLRTKMMIILGGIVISYLGPRYYLIAKIKNRQNAIRIQMPDAMDLLSVSIEAGLSFDGALSRLVQQTKNELTEEMSIMLRQVQMGRTRRDALKDLAQRCDIPELKVFTTSMIQAEQYGIPIKNILKEQASQIRVQRRQSAEEKAMKAPVKMMIPIILFIFPVIFIILLAPAAFDIIETFSG